MHLRESHGKYTGKTKLSIDEVFTKNSTHANDLVRRHLEIHNLLDYACAKCGITDEWQGEKIVLELDHINGDRYDNRVDNLRFLCPNCHSQTSTFRGKNIGSKTKVSVTDEQLLDALKSHSTIRKALRSVGLAGGGNYDRCHRLLAKSDAK